MEFLIQTLPSNIIERRIHDSVNNQLYKEERCTPFVLSRVELMMVAEWMDTWQETAAHPQTQLNLEQYLLPLSSTIQQKKQNSDTYKFIKPNCYYRQTELAIH